MVGHPRAAAHRIWLIPDLRNRSRDSKDLPLIPRIMVKGKIRYGLCPVPKLKLISSDSDPVIRPEHIQTSDNLF